MCPLDERALREPEDGQFDNATVAIEDTQFGVPVPDRVHTVRRPLDLYARPSRKLVADLIDERVCGRAPPRRERMSATGPVRRQTSCIKWVATAIRSPR
jgi:hypothetical protein